ncbi:MAG: hypothetical protein AAF959_24375 [Cyanobacteria bacterium P01_D01_bin.56]
MKVNVTGIQMSRLLLALVTVGLAAAYMPHPRLGSFLYFDRK